MRDIASAQHIEWLPANGPYGGDIIGVAVMDSGGIAIGSDAGGLIASNDQGASWHDISSGFGSRITFITSKRDGRLLVGTGFTGYHSTDGGHSWKLLWWASIPESNALGVPTCGVLIGPSALCLAGTRGILYSRGDDTLRYSNLADRDTPVGALLELPGGELLAAMGNTLYRSSDSGAIWQYGVNAGGAPIISMLSVSASVVVAGTGEGIIRSSDNGRSWIHISAGGVPSDAVRSIVADSAGTLYAGMAHDGIYRSLDRGLTWNPIVPQPPSLLIHTLGIDSIGGLYAATGGGNLYRSDSAGGSWRLIHESKQPWDVTALASSAHGDIFAATSNAQVAPGAIHRSTDNGESWVALLADPDFKLCRGLVSRSRDTIFAAYWGGDGIIRSVDNGAHWTAMNTGLASHFVQGLGSGADGMLFAGTTDGLFVSGDNGVQWKRLGFAGKRVRGGMSLPTGDILAAVNDDGIFRRTVGSSDWEPVLPRETGSVTSAMILNRRGDLFVALGSRGIYRSSDQGSTWLRAGLDTIEASAMLAVDSEDRLYAADARTIYRSVDDGATWTVEMAGLEDAAVASLLAARDGYLYAGTSRGVYRSSGPVSGVGAEGIHHEDAEMIDAEARMEADGLAVRVGLRSPGRVAVDLYDCLGRRVGTFGGGELAAGVHRMVGRIDDLAPGAYLVVVRASGRCRAIPVLLGR